MDFYIKPVDVNNGGSYNIKPRFFDRQVKNVNTQSTYKTSPNDINLKTEKLVGVKVFSQYSYNLLEDPLSQLVGIKIKDDGTEYFSEGNLAKLRIYEHSNNSTNYSKGTIIITKVSSNHLTVKELEYRYVIAIYQSSSGDLIAGTHPVDLKVEFKDDKWYSAYRENNITYCIKVKKVTLENAPLRVHVDHDKVYEFNGELYYDKPQPITSVKIPEWCRVNGSS